MNRYDDTVSYLKVSEYYDKSVSDTKTYIVHGHIKDTVEASKYLDKQ